MFSYEERRRFVKKGDFWIFWKYFIQHCFICRHSDSTVSEKPRTIATFALAVRRSNPSARSHPHSPDLIHTRPDLIHTGPDLISSQQVTKTIRIVLCLISRRTIEGGGGACMCRDKPIPHPQMGRTNTTYNKYFSLIPYAEDH